MEETSNDPNPQLAATQMAIVSPKFCAPNPIELVIVRKILSLSEGNFGVADINGNILFKVKGKHFSLRDRRILLDATAGDLPVLSLQQKILTAHRTWRVFRGGSSEDKDEDLLFSVKKSSIIQLKTKLDVFLASNTSEDVCDFKVEGSWLERSCTIYSGNSHNIVAQMHKKHTVQSIVLGKDTYGVTIYPNVDYAFIVALVVILEEINTDRDSGGYVGGYVGGHACGHVGGACGTACT